MSWYEPLRAIESLGSLAERPGSLAGLAAARREHQGQFFTPDHLAAFVWGIVSPAMNAAVKDRPGAKVSILDNSVGSGRLLQFADPLLHDLAGVDVHGSVVGRLAEEAQKAGFTCEFVEVGMEEVRPKHFNVALINPPFSLHLESPCLKPYPCTTWGKYGPSTSARSDFYAVAQALDAAEIVVAILSDGAATEIASAPWAAPRLQGVFHLPAGVFLATEGTNVRVRVLVFGRDASPAPVVVKVADLSDPVPALPLACSARGGQQALRPVHGKDTEPAITLPVTNDNRVRIVHDGRRLGLRFACGLTQALVLNAVYRDRIATVAVPEHRYPKGILYDGQGALDLEAHLAQPDPFSSFDRLLDAIRAAGGDPVCAPGLREHFKRRVERSRRQSVPLAHTIWSPQGAVSSDRLVGTSRKLQVADQKMWGSPTIKAGEEVEFHKGADGCYSFTVAGKEFSAPLDDLQLRFELSGPSGGGWVVKHQGLLKAYPQQAHNLRRRAEKLGIDKWLWEFQLDDLIELLLKPQGAVVAWEMGLGKARLAAALILLSGCKAGLICVEAYLVEEMLKELRALPLYTDRLRDVDAQKDPEEARRLVEECMLEEIERELREAPIPGDCWQVIRTPGDLKRLKTINIVSYSRLRSPVAPERPKFTYGKALRRRIGILISDEGHLLRNGNSHQSRALWAVSAKRRYCLTGTPVANYPRDILPILAFCGGDGTAAQPWGWRRPFMTQICRSTLQYAQRGIDAFREEFVTHTWITNEFAETMERGAKREIPKIASLDAYRTAIAPHIKRRLVKEPEVAKWVRIPDPVEQTLIVPWDDRHLLHYLTVAEDFANWYRASRERSGQRGNSLIAILARIQAVQLAADYPQKAKEGIVAFHGLTSKQKFAIDLLERYTAEGHKTIYYAANPGHLELIARELSRRGVEAMTFHGGQNIDERTRELDRRFREGDCPNLLASLAVAQAGLNLWCANRVVFGSRDWSAKTEMQALKRVLRPQQTKDVLSTNLELPGSINTYQAQLVAFKKDAMLSGLDWATPETDDVDFLHLDTLLGRFCEEVAYMRGLKGHELRTYLEERAEGRAYGAAA